MTAVISLLTDFGTHDPYVGIMKAVMLSRAPHARFVDLTHDVAPQNVRQGAFALASAVQWFAPGAIHVAVVDPGVGTERRAVVVQTHRARYVAPDNGLLTLALDGDPPVGAWHLTRPQYFLPARSATFHGRDVFAPVAAHLAQGVAPADLGDPIDVAQLVRLPSPAPVPVAGGLRVPVIHADRFGNLVTALHRRQVDERAVIGARAAGRGLRRVETYGDVAPGTLLALWGSSDHLELSVSMGSAAQVLGLGEGDEVDVVIGGEVDP